VRWALNCLAQIHLVARMRYWLLDMAAVGDVDVDGDGDTDGDADGDGNDDGGNGNGGGDVHSP